MGTDIRWQMNCCLCCGGPTDPSRESMRRDKVIARSIYYIEGVAIETASLWNLPNNVQPTLISEKQNLHLFHDTNVLPAVKAFYDGALHDTWLGDDTPWYDAANFALPLASTPAQKAALPAFANFNGHAVDPNITVMLGALKDKKACQWGHPVPLAGFDALADLLEECIDNVGAINNIPSPEVLIPGCKMCNDIMTQQATTSHFLVRKKISDAPLVPTGSILTYKLITNSTVFSADRADAITFNPHDDTMYGRPNSFMYQGCMAYYFHRCLPSRPPAGMLGRELRKREAVRKIMVAFSFIILEVACLTFERFKGLEGGDKALRKPDYRYRGCSETYLSYMFWIIMTNDTPEGEDAAANPGFVSIDFCQFHRYLFCEVVPTLVQCHSAFPNAFELGDVLFGENDEYFLNRESFGMMPGSAIPPIERMLEFICHRVCDFYTDTLKPIFSRHMANLAPDTDLLITGNDDDALLYARQLDTSNNLISITVLRSVAHMLGKATVGDIDTFVECVGSRAVFWLWQRMLETAPVNVERMFDKFMDSLMLMEYKNIQTSMSADASRPAVDEATAEAMYVMCNALTLRAEPKNDQELMEIKQGPLCSPPKAVSRLNQLGAFKREE